MSRRKLIFLIVLALVFTGMAMRYSHRAAKRNYCDFRVYHTTAVRFAEKSDIYRDKEGTLTPFKYSPMFAMLISPMALVDIHTACLLFFAVNFGCLIFILHFFRKLIRERAPTPREAWLLYGAVVLFSFRYILQVFDSGQVNLLMLALVVGALSLFKRGRNAAGGALLALSIMIKYMPALFLPYFILRRAWKPAAWTLLFLVVYSVLPAIHIGVEKEKEYLGNWAPFITKTSLDKGSWMDYKNQSFYSMVLRTVSNESPYKGQAPNLPWLDFKQALYLSVFLSGLIYMLMVYPRPGRNVWDPVEISLLFIAMALFNPNSWLFNYVSLSVAAMTLLDDYLRNREKDRMSLRLLVAAFILSSVGSESLFGNDWEFKTEAGSFLTLSALLLIVALIRLKYKTPTARLS